MATRPSLSLRTCSNTSTGSRAIRVFVPTSPTMKALQSWEFAAIPSRSSASCSGLDSLGTWSVQNLEYSPVAALNFGSRRYVRTSAMDSTLG